MGRSWLGRGMSSAAFVCDTLFDSTASGAKEATGSTCRAPSSLQATLRVSAAGCTQQDQLRCHVRWAGLTDHRIGRREAGYIEDHSRAPANCLRVAKQRQDVWLTPSGAPGESRPLSGTARGFPTACPGPLRRVRSDTAASTLLCTHHSVNTFRRTWSMKPPPASLVTTHLSLCRRRTVRVAGGVSPPICVSPKAGVTAAEATAAADSAATSEAAAAETAATGVQGILLPAWRRRATS
jgi:hypothetical protein